MNDETLSRTIESVVIPCAWSAVGSIVLIGSVIEYSRYAFKLGWCDARLDAPYWRLDHMSGDSHDVLRHYRVQHNGHEATFLDPIMYYAQRAFQILPDTSLADFLLIRFVPDEEGMILHEIARRYASKIGPRGMVDRHFVHYVQPALAQRQADLALDRDS